MAIRHSTPADPNFTPRGKVAWEADHIGDDDVMNYIPVAERDAILSFTSTTDVAPYIQAGIDALEAAGGGVLFFPPGLYIVGTALHVQSDDIYLVGSGKENTIVRPKVGWVAVTLGSGASLSGVINFCGVDYFGCTGFFVDGFTNSIDCNGIIAVPTGTNGAGTICTNGYIRDNKVKIKLDENYHIWTLRGQYIEISGNYCDGSETSFDGSSTQEGIEVYGGYNVTVHNNFVKNIGNNGIFVQSIAATTDDSELQSIRVTNNHIEGCNAGVHLHPTRDATNGDMYAKDILISDNVIIGCWTYGVIAKLTTASSTMEGITISGNTIRGPSSGGQAASRGITFDNQVASVTTVNIRNISITDNRIIDIPLTDAGGAITCNYLTMGRISENQITQSAASLGSGNARGVLLKGCTRFNFQNNTVDGARLYALEIQTSCTHYTVSGNVLLNFNLGSAGVPGLIVSSGTDFAITDNDLDTSDVTNIAKIIGLDSAGLDRYVVRGNRYVNSNSNWGTIALLAFNADKNWTANVTYARKSVVRPTSGGTGFYFIAVAGGTSHNTTEPTWNAQEGALTADNTVTWMARSIYGY